MWAWFQHWTGIDNPSGPIYAWWSGVGSDIGEVTLLGGLWMLYSKHNCHTKGCWRLGKHHVEGTPYIVCPKHHPKVPDEGASAEHIKAVSEGLTSEP